MKKNNLILLFLLAINLMAQERHKTDSFNLNKVEFKIGHFGNLIWDNGLHVGVEYPWKEYTKRKKTSRKQKQILNQLLFNGNIGYKTNFSTETEDGASVELGLIWRRTNTKGRQLSFELNPIGYYRSFLPETYKVDGDRITKVFLPGRSYYSPTASIGIGKARKGKRRSGWYLNLQFTIRTPYNAGTLPLLFIQYGYRFKLKKQS